MNNQRHLKRKDLHSSLSPLSSNRCHSKPYHPRFDEGIVSAVTRKRCCHGQYIRNLTPFCAKANAHKMRIEIQNAHRLRKTPLKCAQGRSQSAEGVLKGQLFEKKSYEHPFEQHPDLRTHRSFAPESCALATWGQWPPNTSTIDPPTGALGMKAKIVRKGGLEHESMRNTLYATTHHQMLFGRI